jgi:hypothetical protein
MDRQKWRLWAERVWRFEQSALTRAEWCRREGLPLEQFYLWRRKLQADAFGHTGLPARALAVEAAPVR